MRVIAGITYHMRSGAPPLATPTDKRPKPTNKHWCHQMRGVRGFGSFFRPSQPQRAENEDALLLYATYSFDNPNQFRSTTQRMVFSTSPWLLTGEFGVPTWGLDENMQALLPQGLLGVCTLPAENIGKPDYVKGKAA